jgi:hypothetical protein
VYRQRWNPNNSIFTGMSTEQLQAALANAQQAYIALSTGTQGVDFTYSQAGGTKHVRYKETDLPQVVALIRELQAQLGITPVPRRAMRFLIQ